MNGLDAAFGYAPGKIILMGEHAVVYGQPAIAATLDRGVRVAVSKRTDDGLSGPTFRGTGLGLETGARPDPDGEGPEALRNALAELIAMFGDEVRGLAFVAEGAIPAGSGLGSSAALSVALVRGVFRFLSKSVTDEEVMGYSHRLERVFHGNPSGVDHSVIAHGGLVWFKKGEPDNVVERIQPGRRIRMAVGLSGKHAGTVHAVGALRDRMRRHPKAYQHLFDGIGGLAQEVRAALEEGHLAKVGELMDLNQGYLNALGVSTPTIEKLCHAARDAGALGAKLTGAGGGGAVIALCDDDPRPVLKAFERAGAHAFAAEIGSDPHEVDDVDPVTVRSAAG